MTRFSHINLFRKPLVAPAAAMLSLAVLPAAAKADNILYPGGYEAGHLFCSPGMVDVWAPYMHAQASGEGVAFLDQLLRWNGSQWVVVSTTPAASQFQTSDIFAQATDSRLNQSTSGGRTWNGEWYFTVPHVTYAVFQYSTGAASACTPRRRRWSRRRSAGRRPAPVRHSVLSQRIGAAGPPGPPFPSSISVGRDLESPPDPGVLPRDVLDAAD